MPQTSGLCYWGHFPARAGVSSSKYLLLYTVKSVLVIAAGILLHITALCRSIIYLEYCLLDRFLSLYNTISVSVVRSIAT